MMDSAGGATGFVRALGHEGRLIILCRLVEGECSVTEMEALLSARQAAVSRQLARLRLGCGEDTPRGRMMYYSLADKRVGRMIGLIYDLFWQDNCRDWDPA